MGRAAPPSHHYFAFLSYSHQDSAEADWLHGELERFRVPSSLAGRLTANGVIPKRLTPIFRDRHELAAGHDLTEEIRVALSASRCLIVLCSPHAAKSKWTNAEIDQFKRLHPDGCIIAAVVAGEPLASDIPGREDEECFPPALVAKYNRRGRPTGQKTEPLAADLREGKGGKRIGFLKIVAGILGIGLDDLVQRDHIRRQRRLAFISTGSIAGMIIASFLAFAAIQARDAARDQRREAESLIGFMLGDLKDKLEPIGKLDALDGVGTRVLAYYQKQGTSDLPDSALLQRSRALSLMGEVASARGDLRTAEALYREAAAGTAEAIRRNPDDPERLFEHAQNDFYLGAIAIARGRFDKAEAAFRDYKSLADRMVAVEPNNMKWRMEVENAEGNLAMVVYQQRRFPEAAALWAQTLRTIDALATADPGNGEYQKSLVESLAWSADAEKEAGHLDAAAALRQRHVQSLSKLYSETKDVNYLQKLVPAERSLGNIYAAQSRLDLALEHLRRAVAFGDRLTPIEPDNKKWLEYSAKAKMNLGELLLLGGRVEEGRRFSDASCAAVSQLLRTDQRVPEWRAALRDCLLLRSQVAMVEGSNAAALTVARQALSVAKSVKSADRVADKFALAKAYRVLGDVQTRQGDTAAQMSWQTALSALPTGVNERLIETSDRAEILQRLGRRAEAGELTKRLAVLGYRYPTLSLNRPRSN